MLKLAEIIYTNTFYWIIDASRHRIWILLCYEIATFEANGDNIWIVSSTRAFGGGQQRAEK